MMHHVLYASPWMVSRQVVIPRGFSWLSIARSLASKISTSSQASPFSYTSTVDAEPLFRYQKGGYHPINLGDLLKNGRYKILHKLGWGGYSTVWAARDQKSEAYVSVKVCISEGEKDAGNNEIQVLNEMASIQPNPQHVVRLFDDFRLEGPNGMHQCLVSEILGPSVSDIIDIHFPDGRLPGALAKNIAKQALHGIQTLHQRQIGHGDLHTRNLAFTIPCMDSLSESEFINLLGAPEIGHVQRSDERVQEPGIPEYIVRPASFQRHFWSSSYHIKIIDFGESFLPTIIPHTLHTPLPVRAPEVIFEDCLDYRVDLWRLGCMVGQPPFDSFMVTPAILVGQMQEMASDTLPTRWHGKWKKMDNGRTAETPGPALQEWLEEMYFDGERKEDLTREDVSKLGRILGRLLRFEPYSRASAREILDDPWFKG
ncbi:serine protein kinase [Aspergillus sclerotiicarbonarius CBS 121057]|uniref:non-specific serine/threonine protein kinase n=1 Tax=Aspergillus sclerotiicarbonarius (strain CBS 121057 / IBT 28362) TaxID=1448318 RepID=A0A319EHL5_ASPSB|nr:serine protein kinase [Aspergillus sclerotiicarbonarius CBS 121057]